MFRLILGCDDLYDMGISIELRLYFDLSIGEFFDNWVSAVLFHYL